MSIDPFESSPLSQVAGGGKMVRFAVSMRSLRPVATLIPLMSAWSHGVLASMHKRILFPFILFSLYEEGDVMEECFPWVCCESMSRVEKGSFLSG